MSDLVFKNVAKAASYLAECRDFGELKDGLSKAKAIEAYQRGRGASLDAQLDAAEIGLRFERRLGELCKEVTGGKPGKNRHSRGNSELLLEDLDIDKAQSSRWQKVAAVPKRTFEQYIDTIRDKGERLTTAGAINAVSDSADYSANEWYTPPRYIEAARDVLGSFDLDPASSSVAQQTVQAGKYFTKEEDGLAHPWKGTVWMNPPYSMPEISQFTNKLADHIEAGDVTDAIVLVNNSTDADWCQRLLQASDAFCFTGSRVAFLQPDGTESKATRRGQVFFYFGGDPDYFAKTFAEFGFIGAGYDR